MNYFFLFLGVAASFANAADKPLNTLSAEERKAGWVLLFDGQSMDHWVDPRAETPPGDAWSIEDQCLKAKAHPAIDEDLFSRAAYRDFELVFEFKISPAGNSGVKYRVQDHFFVNPQPGERFEVAVERSFSNRVARPAQGQDYVVGFEYQITDDAANKDALGNVKHTAGALYDMVAPSAHASRPVGEFNQGRIVVRGKHVEHWLNGVKVVDSALDSEDALAGIRKRWRDSPHILEMMAKQPRKSCPITLQNHGDEAWFRNIKIREIK
jgi:hypothetical protein